VRGAANANSEGMSSASSVPYTIAGCNDTQSVAAGFGSGNCDAGGLDVGGLGGGSLGGVHVKFGGAGGETSRFSSVVVESLPCSDVDHLLRTPERWMVEGPALLAAGDSAGDSAGG